MKKLFLLLIVVLANFSFAQSQSFKDFLPKEGLATAVTQAVTSGITSPALYLIATTTEKNSSMPEILTPKLDLNTGKSPIWLYQFRESTDTTKKIFVAVLKISLGIDQFISQVITDGTQFGQIPSIGMPLSGTNWMNADSMVISLQQSAKFQMYKASNTNTRIQVTLLGINTYNQLFELNKPYWFGIITADGAANSLNCITNCWSGVTSCMDINSIAEDNHGNPVKMYPNPANNLLTIEIPQNWESGALNVSIYNYSGNEVLRSTLKNSQQYLQLPLEFLPNGEYIISINDGKNSVEQLFVVSK